MKLKGNCNCAKLINCNCGTLSFDSYTSPTTSLLTVGNLVASNCTLDGYVIDWYVAGFLMLTTGKGTDPVIQTQHPFTGAASIPVVGGVWNPVVRYIIVGGQRIYSTPVKCRKWCQMNFNLPQITVNSLACGVIGTGANAGNGTYDFKIRYTYANDFSYASRTIRFDLNANAVYFAYSFCGYTVADRIKIFHSNDLNNPITDVIVGTTGVTSQADTMPYRVLSNQHYQQVLLLPSYTAGSYLIIQIIPSVISGNPATDWELYMKCLGVTNFEYNFGSQACWPYDIDSVTVYNDAAACAIKGYINLACNLTDPLGTNLYRYCGLRWFTYYVRSGLQHQFSVSSSVDQSLGNYQKTGAFTKTACYGTMTLSKVGNVYTFSCDNINDYNDLKSGYDYMMASAFYTGWINDPTVKAYYRHFRFYHYNAPIACGQDGETTWVLYFFITSQFVFDPTAMTVTVTCSQVTNSYPAGSDPCVKTRAIIESSVIYNCEATRTRADFTHNTKCRYKYPLGYGEYMAPGITLPFPWDADQVGYSFVNKRSIPQPMTDPKWLVDSSSGKLAFSMSSFKFVPDAARNGTTGEWLADPVQNFSLYCQLNPTTGVFINNNLNSYLIYRKVAGVVTVRVTWEEFVNAMS